MTSKIHAALLAVVASALLPIQLSAETPALEKIKELGAGDFPGGLRYVCVDEKGDVYGGGGGNVVMYDASGAKKTAWDKLPLNVSALAVDSKNDALYAAGIDSSGVAKILALGLKDNAPVVLNSFEVPAKLASISSMRVRSGFIFLATPKPGLIYKYSFGSGALKDSGVIGAGGKISTCCGILSFDINSKGEVVVANLGQHRVTVMNGQGTDYKSVWGKAGKSEADFCGCCNPVSVAVSSDGVIATAEKTIPRLKLYSSDGRKLLAITNDSEFDKSCSHLIIDIDAKKNVYAVDGQSNLIKVFAKKSGASDSVSSASGKKVSSFNGGLN